MSINDDLRALRADMKQLQTWLAPQLERLGREMQANSELRAEVERYKHLANEWADVATNAPQVLRNVRDGLSKFEDAIEYMSLQCRRAQKLNAPAGGRELRAEVARYKVALQAISLGPPHRMLNNVDRWATDLASEALEPPSGETSASAFRPQCPLCNGLGLIAHNRLTGQWVACPKCAAASAQEQK